MIVIFNIEYYYCWVGGSVSKCLTNPAPEAWFGERKGKTDFSLIRILRHFDHICGSMVSANLLPIGSDRHFTCKHQRRLWGDWVGLNAPLRFHVLTRLPGTRETVVALSTSLLDRTVSFQLSQATALLHRQRLYERVQRMTLAVNQHHYPKIQEVLLLQLC